jgi:hypothetical protein
MSAHAIKHTPIHPDGKSPIDRVLRFDHEWTLEDYEWDPQTGEARCEYSRTCCHPDPETEIAVVTRSQPSGRWHAGWQMWNGRFTTEHR